MKRLFTAVILALFVFQGASFAQSTHEAVQKESAEVMVRLGLLKGYKNGDLGLERNITRAEFAVIIARMLGYEANPFTVSSKISFKDISKKHWAHPSVMMVASKGYLKGYSDKTFKPSRNITYAEAAAIMVRILGYDNQLKGKWPNNYINRAKEIGITNNLNMVANKAITRGDIAILVVNSLSVEVKEPEKK